MKKMMIVIAGLGTLMVAAPVGAQGFDAMAMADADHDGKVTVEEYSGFRESGWGFFAQGGDSVKLAELPDMAKGAFKGIAPDASGMVSHATYTAASPAMFKAADKDGNGSLSAEELNTTM